MIDDALCAKGCEPGYYELGGNQIDIREKRLRLSARHRHAGRRHFEVQPRPAEPGRKGAGRCLTGPSTWYPLNPARLLKMDDRKGKIMAGYDADLVVLNRDYDVVQTYCLGKEIKT